ncbi:hypothetical protein [Streptomyces albiflavescens]|uniref:hypothetical protein n=1 Tax=Streptomyces albiflavescens TaxID=1623582 RepID=UPI001E3B424F|nr:hypothetical protein [Streptomyces albiflavescens]
MASARARAPQERQQAAAPVRRAALRDADAVRAVGEHAASLVRERARERVPSLVVRVVADALRIADRPDGAP